MVSRITSIVYDAAFANPIPIVETVFISPEILNRVDAAHRKSRLANIVAAEIVPRLIMLHTEVLPADGVPAPSEDEIVELAHLVLSPNLQAAAAYVTILRERGLSMETLCVMLLQPAARHLGKMWENDECDFIDVTLGIGQLQKLLSIFNCTYDIPSIDKKRRVFLTLTPGEQHSFGLAMVAKLLRAAGWNVTTPDTPTIASVTQAVRKDWYAVAGIALSSSERVDDIASTIATIRKNSRNPAIGIMVGGPPFAENSNLVTRIRADATADNATTAVILAQKLFDLGAKSGWNNTAP